MSHNPDDKNVRYFATGNSISPFVAVFGDWSTNSALVRGSLRNGVKLGKRPMIDCEIEANDKSTRSMFMYWPSIHSMLWTHRGPNLIHFYPTLIKNIRIKIRDIRLKTLIIAKKRQDKAAKKLVLSQVIERNKIIPVAPVIKNDFTDLLQAINQYKYEFEYNIIGDLNLIPER